MMESVIVVIVMLTALFIARDILKWRHAPLHTPSQIQRQNEAARLDSERTVRLEQEVDEKFMEIERHKSRVMPVVPAPSPPPKASPGARPSGKDSMNDTRCIQTVKQKVDEFERVVREKGASKS